MKSRPVYPGFRVDLPAQRHLLALEGHGALAVLEKLTPGHAMLERAEVLYASSDDATGYAPALAALNPAAFWEAPSTETLLGRLSAMLSTATMGTRLYAAGTEPFIGAVVVIGAEHGIKHLSISTEHRGSLRRRVQCVHCKGFIDDVTISPVPCTHCGTLLFVRDHFSRRLNAFQGVSINAEEPDVVPEAEELYP